MIFAILTTVFCIFGFLFGRLISNDKRRYLVGKLFEELDEKDKDFDVKIEIIKKFNY